MPREIRPRRRVHAKQPRGSVKNSSMALPQDSGLQRFTVHGAVDGLRGYSAKSLLRALGHKSNRQHTAPTLNCCAALERCSLHRLRQLSRKASRLGDGRLLNGPGLPLHRKHRHCIRNAARCHAVPRTATLGQSDPCVLECRRRRFPSRHDAEHCWSAGYLHGVCDVQWVQRAVHEEREGPVRAC